jgi:hypothetical protein
MKKLAKLLDLHAQNEATFSYQVSNYVNFFGDDNSASESLACTDCTGVIVLPVVCHVCITCTIILMILIRFFYTFAMPLGRIFLEN